MIRPEVQRLWRLDPLRGRAPARSAPDRIERVLHVHLSTPEEPVTSLCHALASLAAGGGYVCVEWTPLSPRARHQAILAAAAELRPTLVFMQLQRADALGPETIAELRCVAQSPDLVVASWCGDIGGGNGPVDAPDDRWAYVLSAQCDLMLYSSMSQVRAHRSRGMHNAAYLQIGYDEDRYFPGPEDGYGKSYDVAMLAANYSAYVRGKSSVEDAGLRHALAREMRRAFDKRFGLFGSGWGSGVKHLPPARSGDVYRSSHLALSISLSSSFERYTSDRLFRALACGTPVLMKAFSDWESFGLVAGKNVLVWNTPEEAVALAREWVCAPRRDALREIGRHGAALAREQHSWGVRMLELQPLIGAMRGSQLETMEPW